QRKTSRNDARRPRAQPEQAADGFTKLGERAPYLYARLRRDNEPGQSIYERRLAGVRVVQYARRKHAAGYSFEAPGSLLWRNHGLACVREDTPEGVQLSRGRS